MQFVPVQLHWLAYRTLPQLAELPQALSPSTAIPLLVSAADALATLQRPAVMLPATHVVQVGEGLSAFPGGGVCPGGGVFTPGQFWK